LLHPVEVHTANTGRGQLGYDPSDVRDLPAEHRERLNAQLIHLGHPQRDLTRPQDAGERSGLFDDKTEATAEEVLGSFKVS
jgi:hypothetical protein